MHLFAALSFITVSGLRTAGKKQWRRRCGIKQDRVIWCRMAPITCAVLQALIRYFPGPVLIGKKQGGRIVQNRAGGYFK